MTEAATKDDVSRIHDRIDGLAKEQKSDMEGLTKAQHATALELARIAVVLEKYERPCNTVVSLKDKVQDHIKKHEENTTLWKRPIISAVVTLLQMGGVALLTGWLAATKF